MSNIQEEVKEKKNKRNSIVRVVHNGANPFVQLNKSALWDQKLSLKATGLWARCMSRPDDWQFNMSELIEKSQEGKTAVFGAMKEIIKAGYAIRIQHFVKENGKITESGLHYIFFEFPATEEDKEKQLKLFEHDFRNPDFWDPCFWDPRNRQLLIHILTEKEVLSKSNTEKDKDYVPPQKSEAVASKPADAGECEVLKSSKKKIRSLDSYSLVVQEVTQKMIQICKQCNPVYRPPDKIDKFLQVVEMIVEQDQQDIALLLKTFEWGCRDNEKRGDFSGWQGIIITNNKGGKPTNPAEIFRKYYSKIHSQMNSKIGNQVDRRTKNSDGTPVDAPHLEGLF